jgi:hypothetical protein
MVKQARGEIRNISTRTQREEKKPKQYAPVIA